MWVAPCQSYALVAFVKVNNFPLTQKLINKVLQYKEHVTIMLGNCFHHKSVSRPEERFHRKRLYLKSNSTSRINPLMSLLSSSILHNFSTNPITLNMTEKGYVQIIKTLCWEVFLLLAPRCEICDYNTRRTHHYSVSFWFPRPEALGSLWYGQKDLKEVLLKHTRLTWPDPKHKSPQEHFLN